MPTQHITITNEKGLTHDEQVRVEALKLVMGSKAVDSGWAAIYVIDEAKKYVKYITTGENYV